jgi:hypothetical protein
MGPTWNALFLPPPVEGARLQFHTGSTVCRVNGGLRLTNPRLLGQPPRWLVGNTVPETGAMSNEPRLLESWRLAPHCLTPAKLK